MSDYSPAVRETPLSLRERQVLQLSGEGFTRDEIAGALGITLETVKSHMRWATIKLGARNRVHAAVLFALAQAKVEASETTGV